ncbi:MAG: hypothetical protein ACT4PV_05655 [Planctomycetaceae bacterium]
MPLDPVERVLHYVGVLLLLATASTFPWWIAANLVRAEYRRVLSALACSMRHFFYSICLLCILVAGRSLHLEPIDPRSTLYRDLHLWGTLVIAFPCAWRAFRLKGPRMVLLVAIAAALSGGLFLAAATASPAFARTLAELPFALVRAR